MMVKKFWIGGNWKCNGTLSSISTLAKDLNNVKRLDHTEMVIFPASVHYCHTRKELNNKFKVGLQNVSETGNGAFTGEISAEMVADIKVEYCLVGHSERRNIFKECCDTVATKAQNLEQQGVTPVICIGETIEQRKANETEKVCKSQLLPCFDKVKNWKNVVIAYEPVWAIGTGLTATPEQAQEAHKYIRSLLTEKLGAEVANEIRIVYGGSVNEKNCKELAKQSEINGFLVGGASLKPSFNIVLEAFD